MVSAECWGRRKGRAGGLGLARAGDALGSAFLFLFLLLFASTDGFETGFDVVHDAADGDFVAGVGVG